MMIEERHGPAAHNLSFELIEKQALHQEMATRIIIQNMAVLALAPMLLAAGLAMLAWPEAAMHAAVVFCLASGISALTWCHNGVRQAQLKSYLVLLANRHSIDGGWERWLPHDRMPGLLGNRWFVATKGAMMGAQASALAMALHVGGLPQWPALTATLLLIAGTIWLLLTNPKESLPPSPA